MERLIKPSHGVLVLFGVFSCLAVAVYFRLATTVGTASAVLAGVAVICTGVFLGLSLRVGGLNKDRRAFAMRLALVFAMLLSVGIACYEPKLIPFSKRSREDTIRRQDYREAIESILAMDEFQEIDFELHFGKGVGVSLSGEVKCEEDFASLVRAVNERFDGVFVDIHITDTSRSAYGDYRSDPLGTDPLR